LGFGRIEASFYLHVDRQAAKSTGLIFNEGYPSSSDPDLWRSDLSNEAIRLTRGRGSRKEQSHGTST
jgi:tRNA U34 5-methylaminomethyl-2-thiouridine-forming methyltransferase MnmC